MAGSRRRRARGRAGPPRVFLFAILAVVFVGAAIYGCVAINHQIKGYFGGARGHGAVATPVPSPTPAAGEAQSPAPGMAAPSGSPVESPLPSGVPRVAIIIDDCGYSEERCKLFLQLPIDITLSILPLSPHGKQIEADARAAGKAVMLHLPMQPDSPQANPGPGAITTAMTDEQVQAQVATDVDSLADMPGANNHMGSRATSDPRVMRDVLGVLQERHMFFIDSLTSYSTVGESTAHKLGIPTAERDIFLDDQKDLPYIRGQLEQLQAVALRRGSAIAIGHPNETTAQALAEAIPGMRSAGIVFVNAESLVK